MNTGVSEGYIVLSTCTVNIGDLEGYVDLSSCRVNTDPDRYIAFSSCRVNTEVPEGYIVLSSYSMTISKVKETFQANITIAYM